MARNPRKKAVCILMDIEKNAAYANIEMNSLRAQNEFSDTDIRFIGELVNGVLKRKITLDYVISKHSTVKINKISPYVINVLRLGIYQIMYMDKVPVSAAVNESVKLIKNSSVSRLSGFVNAVLRAVDTSELSCLDLKNPKDISIYYSLPEWMVNRWLKLYGYDFALELIESFAQKAPLCIRRSPGISPSDFTDKLKNEGVDVSPFIFDDFPDYDCSYVVNSSDGPITRCASFEDGDFYIQDPAASLVSYLLSPQKGETVIDMCSAPGGKSIFAAQLMCNTGTIYAFDIYDHKLELIHDNCKRHNIDIIRPINQDASIFNEAYANIADKIICDVPCSGLGLMRKKPEIRFTRTENDISELALLSEKILAVAARYLKCGGTLVYSTCTVEPCENEEVIKRFLDIHKDFTPIKITKDNFYKTFYPNVDTTDGFFVCLLKKNGENL